MTGIGEEYECANCHGTFTKTVDDEEALAELAAEFMPMPGGDQLEVICDDCYQAIMTRIRDEAPELLSETYAQAIEAGHKAALDQRHAKIVEELNQLAELPGDMRKAAGDAQGRAR